MKNIYLIGSLRNPEIPLFAGDLRKAGFDVFDSWYAAGDKADDAWQAYSDQRGLTFEEALQDHSAQHVFQFDKKFLDRADAAVLLMPAGKSGHLELGYMVGRGKPTAIVIPETPPRYDVMYNFAERVFVGTDSMIRCEAWLQRKFAVTL